MRTIYFLQNKREKLETVLRENENVTLYTNHFLLTKAREKLIQTIMAIRRKISDEKESTNLLKYQIDLFKKVAEPMSKVDLPRDFWDQTLEKMESDLEERTKKV